MDDLSTAPHQLATLTPLRLTVFARSLVQPPPSPSSSTSPPLSAAYLDRLQDVLVLTVDLKLVALASQCSWNPFTNPRRSQLDDWVRTLLQAFTTAGSTELVAADDACKVAALGGLYKGLTAAGTSKGLRRDVEIELLVAVEIGLDAVLKVRSEGKGKAREDGLGSSHLTCFPPVGCCQRSHFPYRNRSSSNHPPCRCLVAAHVAALVCESTQHAGTSRPSSLRRSYAEFSTHIRAEQNLIRLSTDSVDSTTSKADLDALAAIVTSSLKALAVDRLQLDRLRSSASELTTSLLDLCSSSTNTESDLSTLFFSFIAPVSSVLADLLLSAPFRPAVAQRISHNLLLVIHRWAEMIDQAGGLDGDYEVGKTWWTVVDVLMSRNWTDDKRVKVLQNMANASRMFSLTSSLGQSIRVLTRSLLYTKDSSAEDNLVLLLAEQVIGGSSLKILLPVLNDVVVPICHRCVLFAPYCGPSTSTKSGFDHHAGTSTTSRISRRSSRLTRSSWQSSTSRYVVRRRVSHRLPSRPSSRRSFRTTLGFCCRYVRSHGVKDL